MIGAHIGVTAGRGLDLGLAGGGLKLAFQSRFYEQLDTDGDNMARTSDFTNIGTVLRASKAWYPGDWDFTNGGAIGTLTEYAANTIRDGSAGALIEDSSTNEMRNPRFEGGTAGALSGSGAIPTYFADLTSGLADAAASVDYGTEDGWPYMDLIFSGSAGDDVFLLMEGSTQVTAADGEDWTFTLPMKLVSGDFTNVDDIQLRLYERTSAGAIVKAVDSADFMDTIDGTRRGFSFTRTLDGGGTTARVQHALVIGYTSGNWTFTLRLYAPQLENQEAPTSIILPEAASPAATTRAADDITVAVGAWLGSAHTLYCNVVYNYESASLNSYHATLSDASTSDLIAIGRNTLDTALWIVRAASATVANGSLQAATTGEQLKAVVSVDTDNIAASGTGATQDTDSSAALPDFTGGEIQIGAYAGGASFRVLSMYVKDLRYWPRRLTNAELEALVGN